MEQFTAIIGIISVCLVGVWAQETVSVAQTEYSMKPGQDLSLTCVGSSTDLGFYIENRVGWRFIDMDGKETILTEGFYIEKDTPQFSGLVPRYNYSYGDAANGYRFQIDITGITHEDNGIYRCALLNTKGNITDSKNVTLTVVTPVQRVALEIHDPTTHAVLAKKTTAAGDNETPVKLKPGNYMVKCVASGSNPAPSVQVLYNDQAAGYAPLTTTKSITGNQVKYTSTYSVPSFTFESSGMDQFLTCSANIPGNYYSQKEAGIKMVVRVDKPDIMCAPLSRRLDDRYGMIECNITAPGGGLQCDMVKWYIGNTNEMIMANGKFGSEDHKYDIMESSCENVDQKLDVSLTVYHLKEAHFETIFYLSYGIGEDAHRVPFEIDQISGSSSFVNPFSLFIYLVITLVTRQAMQRF